MEENKTYEATEMGTLDDALRYMYLTFAIDGEGYGVEVRYITEIINIQKITKLPNTDVYIKGIINLRGSIIPVVDIRLKFGKPEREYDSLTCIIVLEHNGLCIGVIVDRVLEVLSIAEQNILPPPAAQHGYRNQYVKSLAKVDEQVKSSDQVKMILDVERMLFCLE